MNGHVLYKIQCILHKIPYEKHITLRMNDFRLDGHIMRS